MIISIEVPYDETVFIVSGDWEPYSPAIVKADPNDCREAEGGCFKECDIYYAGKAFYNLMSETVRNEIIKIAEARAKAEFGR